MSGDTNAAVRREDGQVHVDAPAMERFVGAIFERAGCDAEEAHRIAWRLTGANLRGHDSHGVLRTRRYVEWIEEGRVFPGRSIKVERETEALAVVDGDYGFGQTVGEQTVDLGVEKARRHGWRSPRSRTPGTSAASVTGRSERRSRAAHPSTW